MKVERRLPYGFVGDWAVLYKLYIFDDYGSGEVIQYQNNNYLKMSTKVQFKGNGTKMRSNTQQVSDLVSSATNIVVETTDAYFDVEKGVYRCVVTPGDVVKYRGDWWEVEKIDIEVRYALGKQEHYFCTLKRIEEGIIEW